ncbi:MAG: gluconokinase [Rhodanobacter sp.]
MVKASSQAGGMIIVVMGVSGSGKSTLGQALAAAIGADFQEGDDLHPPANIAKMRAGLPLDDEDRAPWLERIATWIASERSSQRQGVVACSALKRRYRQRLRQAADGMRFIYLQVSPNALQERLQRRTHFMPAGLLDSQLRTLEDPRNEPDVLLVDGADDLARIVADARRWLTQPLPGVEPQAT